MFFTKKTQNASVTHRVAGFKTRHSVWLDYFMLTTKLRFKNAFKQWFKDLVAA
ncbi:MAG: hypothetical protein RL329_3443 [Bacteroidota bacterium]|jgi:hypothetical protein